jgi:hypothetical protein
VREQFVALAYDDAGHDADGTTKVPTQGYNVFGAVTTACENSCDERVCVHARRFPLLRLSGDSNSLRESLERSCLDQH